MRDPTDITGLAADAEELKLQEQQVQRQEVEDLKWLMAHKQGRRLVWKWLAEAGVFRTPFNHSGSITAFNCGRMNMGQQLLGEIMEHTPDAFNVMLKEQRAND